MSVLPCHTKTPSAITTWALLGARDGWTELPTPQPLRQVADTFQGVLLLFYPQNIWVIPFSSPEGEKVALCLFIEEARGSVRPP